MLDLDFTEEQDMLRDMVRGVCEQHAPLERVRELEDDPVGYPPELWDQFAELGLCGLMIPDDLGGSGMTMIEGVVVYEELGRTLAPVPHFVSCVVSAGALIHGGTEAQQQEWVPALAAGSVIMTPAWLEPGNGFSPLGVQLRATADGDEFVLSGSKAHVVQAAAADRLVVLARTGDEEAAVDLFLVDPQADGVTMTQQHSISSDTQYQVDLAEVRVAAADRIGGAGSGWATWTQVMSESIILLAAQAIGGARQTLDITVQYAKDREQFDKPLGAFQSLSHYMADASTEIDGGAVLVYEAAWAHSTGRQIRRLAPMAKRFACQVFRDTTAMAQQIFGGVGFTLEYDVQLYFRRAKQLQLSWWDGRALDDLIASAVLDGDAA